MKLLYVIGQDAFPESFQLGADESLELTFIALPGTSADLSLKVDMLGPGASADIFGLYLCGEEERLSINVELCHKLGGGRSNQIIRGVVGGHARTAFYGRITVSPDAQKTEACQSNHNLLLSDAAIVNTKPQLEIYADDVKCSHGATVGRLDEEEQFYMRSRGITAEEARKLQILSFVSPILDTIDDEQIKERVAAAIDKLSI